MEIFIPKSINFEQLEEEHSTTGIRGYHRDKLAYLISLITVKPLHNKETQFFRLGDRVIENPWDDWKALNAQILQSKVHNYNQYFSYLINDAQIVQRLSYIPQYVSRQYRLIRPYYGDELVSYKLTYGTLIRAIRKYQVEQFNELAKEFGHLTKWFKTKKLDVDYENAVKYIHAEKKKMEVEAKSRNKRPNYSKYNRSSILINYIKNKEPYVMVDQTVGRMHSMLTNLPKDLRKFISFNGKPLLTVDMSNSQPYITLLLLNNRFYPGSNDTDSYVIDHASINPDSSLDQRTQQAAGYVNVASFFLRSYCPPYMLEESWNVPDNQDIALYADVVSNGRVYEHFLERCIDQSIPRVTDRDHVKTKFLVIINGKHLSDQALRFHPASRLFRDEFPTIFNILQRIKEADYKNVSYLLLKLESYLMLKVITKEINWRNFRVPIFTIHDGIITTVGNEEFVRQTISEVYTEIVGHAPTLHYEPWDDTSQ